MITRFTLFLAVLFAPAIAGAETFKIVKGENGPEFHVLEFKDGGRSFDGMIVFGKSVADRCKDRLLNGAKDWRLPSIAELAALSKSGIASSSEFDKSTQFASTEFIARYQESLDIYHVGWQPKNCSTRGCRAIAAQNWNYGTHYGWIMDVKTGKFSDWNMHDKPLQNFCVRNRAPRLGYLGWHSSGTTPKKCHPGSRGYAFQDICVAMPE